MTDFNFSFARWRIGLGLLVCATTLLAEPTLDLESLSQQPPVSVDQALAGQKRQAGTLNLELPPDLNQLMTSSQAKENSDLLRLSLPEVRAMALRNNLDLQIAVLDPVIAATQVSEEEAKFDQVIFVHAKYGQKDTPYYDDDMVTFSALDSELEKVSGKLSLLPQQTDYFSVEGGVEVPLKTGGKVVLSTPLQHKQTYKGITTDEYRSALKFSISQPLLRGMGIENNTAAIRIAEYQQQTADVYTRLKTIRVLAEIDRIYWKLYEAWEVLNVRRLQYENATNHQMMVQRRIQEGLTAQVELNRAEIGVAERLEKLIMARTQVKQVQRKLKLYLNDTNMALDSDQWLAPKSEPTLFKFDFDRQQVEEQALAGRLELLELELKLAQDATKIAYLENQTLPLFMLEYRYAFNGRSDQSAGDSYEQVFSNDYNDWSIGLKFELPVTNAAREAQLERAVQQKMQRLTTQRLRQLSIRREIFDALDQVEQNWQRILANRQNVILAGLNYQAEIRQFTEGFRTMTEVLEMLTKLGEAQVREVKAVADYQIALIDLAYATGTLLGYSKTGWQN